MLESLRARPVPEPEALPRSRIPIRAGDTAKSFLPEDTSSQSFVKDPPYRSPGSGILLPASEHNFTLQWDCKLLAVKGTRHCALVRRGVGNPQTLVADSFTNVADAPGAEIWRCAEERSEVRPVFEIVTHRHEETALQSKTTCDSFS